MSENGDECGDGGDKNICRDYLRNVCFRGNSCKYSHPVRKDKKKTYVFCHDFQNGKCSRKDCIFIHCSRQDEEMYNKTGDLPPYVEIPLKCDDEPVCKDFLKGDCHRPRCKFRHVLQRDYFNDDRPHFPDRPNPRSNNSVNSSGGMFPRRPGADSRDYRDRDYNDRNGVDDRMNFKRRRYDDMDDFYPRRNNFSDRDSHWLEGENNSLRKQVADLKRKIDDLQATNEFLLEQNAQYRLREKNQTLAAMTVPAVTITNSQLPSGQNQMQPTQISQQVIRTVAASVATVPVSLAAVTPVSLAAVSMAPVVTVAQQQTTMALSGASQPLVSYPIVTRSVLQNNMQH
ncbi:unnamed protein product [Bemisia tabaci]|uniref:C3H1-type domain-containing protein n=1 Tax=Bemisia tabaci TaxID=7038 RepID=A0A9P0EW87_BEMTA|nr:unnamed protein product [Bemisia tabaci]